MQRLSIVFLILIAGGCKQSPGMPDNFDYGTIDKGFYKNEFFGMEIPVTGWHVQSKNEMEQIVKKGAEEVGKKNKKLASELKANQVKTASLLMMFKYPGDSAVLEIDEFNSSFVLMAENIREHIRIRTSTDYLDELKKELKKMGMDFQVSHYYSARKIGDREFDVLRVSTNTSEGEVTQLYCCAVEKGFAIVIALSFVGDQQEEELTNLIRKIKSK